MGGENTIRKTVKTSDTVKEIAIQLRYPLDSDRWWIGSWHWFSRWIAIHLLSNWDHIELATINHSFPDRYGPAVDRARLVGAKRWTEVKRKKRRGRGREKEASRTSSTVFLFNLGPAARAAALLLRVLLRADNRLYLPAIHVNVTGYHNQNVIEILFRSLQHWRPCSKIYKKVLLILNTFLW